jgi:hypothetical protein
MRSRAGQSLSTLFFLLPLLGVPLMAIFGVPQFVPVVASSASDQTTMTNGRRPTRVAVGESAASRSQLPDQITRVNQTRESPVLCDLFRSSESPQRERPSDNSSFPSRGADSLATGMERNARRDSTGSALHTPVSNRGLSDLFGEETSVATTRPAVLRHPNEGNVSRSRFAAAENRGFSKEVIVDQQPQITWSEAVRRFHELGIHDFRLEPGKQFGEFYFVCEFAPGRDARVIRRFEAEAREPLLAVEAVLQQIDEWLSRR